MKDSLHYLLMADHLLFQKILFTNLKDTGFTLGQPKILEYLLYHDGTVQKEIAEACHIEPATMTSILLGMEKKGFIIRRNEHGNRRSLYVYLTEKGRMAAERLEVQFREIEEMALCGFDEEERGEFIYFLKRVKKNMLGKEMKHEEE